MTEFEMIKNDTLSELMLNVKWAQKVVIIDFSHLENIYPIISQDYRVINVGGLPWMAIGSLVVRSVFELPNTEALSQTFTQNDFDIITVEFIATEVFGILEWADPSEAAMRAMMDIIIGVRRSVASFTQKKTAFENWEAITMRGKSAVVFGYIPNQP